ncbi:hypothetical protein ACXHXM_34125
MKVLPVLDVNEASRTYHFQSGNVITFEDIVRIQPMLSEGSSHFLWMADGTRIAIVEPYDALEIVSR